MLLDFGLLLSYRCRDVAPLDLLELQNIWHLSRVLLTKRVLLRTGIQWGVMLYEVLAGVLPFTGSPLDIP